jgi:hypothetical protein
MRIDPAILVVGVQREAEPVDRIAAGPYSAAEP